MPSRRRVTGYNANVFLNCPFDPDYKKLFNAIVFTVLDCGYTVRCALEAEDSGPTRIERIYLLIQESRFGIHDISRIQQDPSSGLPRFNMPFELGLFLGARRFGSREQRKKSCLILEAERYEYQKFLSDVAGQDIRPHDNDHRQAVGAIRDWLAASRSGDDPYLPGARAILKHYGEFKRALPAMLRIANIKPRELGFVDRTNFMVEFIERRAAQVAHPR